MKKSDKHNTYSNIAVFKDYSLLPFNYSQFHNKELIVNLFGDYLIVQNGTVDRIINRTLNKYNDNDIYTDLISNNFITKETVPINLNVLATRYRTKKGLLNYFTGLHIVVPTLRCNQACIYCQVSHVSSDDCSYDIDFRTIDNVLDIIFKSNNPSITIEFQGGEPLLAFDKIKYVVGRSKEYIKNDLPKVTFVICTNLTLLNDEMLNYIKENNILISTSLDGPKIVHNKNRIFTKNYSYKSTVEKIIKCQKVLGQDRVSALMTTTGYSLNYWKEIIDEYISLGFHEIFLRSINPYGFALKNCNENLYSVDDFIDFYKKALDYIIEYNQKGNYFVEVYAKIILSKILTPFSNGFVDLQSPAGLINSVAVYNYNGNVYPSDEARMLAEMGDDYFLLGNVNRDNYYDIFYGSKSKEIANTWANECLNGCVDCAFQTYCGADPVRNYSTQKDMYGFRPTSSFCKKNKMIIEYLLELIESDKKIELIFNSWVAN